MTPEPQPGDCLLYAGTGFFSRIIKIKTWSPVSHCELYIGDGQSVASRDGVGVGTFTVRTDGLYAVLRPLAPFNLPKAMRWYKTVEGQRYDWLGLLRMFTIGEQSTNMQFCSEFETRMYRAGDFEPFTPEIDADLVAPGQYLYSPRFLRVREGAAV